MVRQRKQRQVGFSLVEVIMAVGIISILAATLIPVLGKSAIIDKEARVRVKLKNIQQALTLHLLTKTGFRGDFPASLTAADFLSKQLNPGLSIGSSGNSALKDDFSPAGANLQYAISGSTDYTAYVWSVGPDGEDDTHSDDDIWIELHREPICTWITERQLNMINAKIAWHYLNYGRADTDQALLWVEGYQDYGCGLDSVYDGFGKLFHYLNNLNTLLGNVFSEGADETQNTGQTDESVGTGDDLRP